jgi:hypothetical protein
MNLLTGCTRFLRTTALAILLIGASPAFGADGAIAKIDGEAKRVEGILREAQAGDIACYLSFEAADGTRFDESASFELCDDPALIGKRLKLSYSTANVLAAECQGDMDCGKSDQVVLVSAVEVLGVADDAPSAARADEPTFCSADETVVFACRTGSKLVSVCASPDATADSGHLHYRFGKPGAAPPYELSLPRTATPPARSATGEAMPFSGGGGSWLRFRNGQHAYVVYTGIGRWGPQGETMEKQGLVVEHRGEVLASLPCSGPYVSELGPVWFEQVGIEGGGEEFFFPD